MPIPHWTIDQIKARLVSDNATWSPAITYSFPVDPFGTYNGAGERQHFFALDAATQAEVRVAFQAWDDLIAANLTELPPSSTYVTANIEVAFTQAPGDWFFAQTYSTQGTIWLNQNYNTGVNNLIGATPGNYGFVTYLHEIGHALGLDHVGDYNGDAEGDVPIAYEDSTVYSVMSYFGPNGPELNPEVADADWRIGTTRYDPQTPMVYDVYAIQSEYGASTTTRTDDTTYGFHSNVTGSMAPIYDFTLNAAPILCLFDSAGNDTLDLSGWAGNSTISLVPGSFSSGGEMTYNISIAFSTTIENAVGGSGNDTLVGNSVSNHLDGGAGTDTVIFSGTRASYNVTSGAGSKTFASAADGTDTLTSIERFEFSDIGIAYDLAGDAGHVARILGAVFGPSLVNVPAYVGIGIDYANGGMSYQDLMQLALDVRLGQGASHEAVVSLLWTNVMGTTPGALDIAPYVAMLDSGGQTAGSLGVIAAETDINAGRIGLAGLAVTGLEYL